MSKPQNLKTRIFLDGGDPEETEEIIKELGFLDGQTTNPTLVSKNPGIAQRIARGEKFTAAKILNLYKDIVAKISYLIPEGSVSIEVYCDKNTTAKEMLTQAKEMNSWIPNAHIKFPATYEGLKAANESIRLGFRVNVTLVFTQKQAAAVYAATRGAIKGQVFVSPFIGRLDDKGENGMDLIKNILKMYASGDEHIEVLTASVRDLEQFQYALSLGTDIITSPFKLLKDWVRKGMSIPENYSYNAKGLKPIEYQDLDLNKTLQEFNIKNELTDAGIEKFSSDWNTLILS